MKHHLSFHKMKPQDVSKGGYRTRATKSNFPALQDMSFYKLTLNPKAVREPHWHANADELGYCLQGKLLISFYANENHKERFVVEEGEMFLIPAGALHSLENIGKKSAEVILQFSHAEPEDFGLSSVFGTFSDAVLGNTWNVAASHFYKMKRVKKETFIAELETSTSVKGKNSSPYRFPVEKSSPLIATHGGTAKVARQDVWKVLGRQAMYSVRLDAKGMREPHWHPETCEMGYVAKGRGRMSIQSPNGKVDTYVMEEGDLYFIPKAYPHHIENLQTSELHLLIFFDRSMPEDIGFTGSVKSFSDEVLSSIMHCEKKVFSTLPSYKEDLLIVTKKNPVD